MAIDRQSFLAQVREWLRDKPELNALLEGEETNDLLLELCAELAADDWSESPPILSRVTIESHPSRYCLFYGTIIEVLRSAGVLQSRNNLNYSDGGLTVATSDKAPQYLAWINHLLQTYEYRKRSLKKAQNVAIGSGAWGGVSSEYAFIGSYGHYLSYGNLDQFSALRFGLSIP